MTNTLKNSALGGAAVAGALAVALALGLIDLPGGGDTPADDAARVSPGADATQAPAGDAGVIEALVPAAGEDATVRTEGAKDGQEPSRAELVETGDAGQAASQQTETTASPETADSAAVSEPAEVGDGTSAADPVPSEDMETADATVAMPSANEAPVVSDPSAPSFDTVRAEPGGSTLVAGAGQPGAEIDVLVDGDPAATALIGRDGRFVAFLDLPSEGKASVLRLRSRADSGEVMSQDEVIVAPAALSSDVTQPPRFEQRAAAAPGPLGQPQAPDRAAVSGTQPDATALGADTVRTDPAQAPSLDAVATAAPMPQPGSVPQALGDDVGQDESVPAGELASFSAPRPATPGGLDLASTSGSAPVATDDPEAPPSVATAEPGAPAMPADAAAPAGTPSAHDTDIASRDPASQPDETGAPQAPKVFVSGPQGVEVLASGPLQPDEVALDTINYGSAGEVLLTGRGADDAFVRVYLDNRPVTTSRIAESGRWKVQLPDVDTGTYTLRVDQIDGDGTVLARVESPFLREDPDLLASLERSDGPISEITVQPGNTLWGISQDRYGHGIEYVKIFQANRERIRNPDLIYPGQIFDLPDGTPAATE